MFSFSIQISLYAFAVFEGLNVKMKTFRMNFHNIGLTSITLLSERNSLRYLLISNQLVDSGVPRLINKTPVFPKLIFGWSSIN